MYTALGDDHYTKKNDTIVHRTKRADPQGLQQTLWKGPLGGVRWPPRPRDVAHGGEADVHAAEGLAAVGQHLARPGLHSTSGAVDAIGRTEFPGKRLRLRLPSSLRLGATLYVVSNTREATLITEYL